MNNFVSRGPQSFSTLGMKPFSLAGLPGSLTAFCPDRLYQLEPDHTALVIIPRTVQQLKTLFTESNMFPITLPDKLMVSPLTRTWGNNSMEELWAEGGTSVVLSKQQAGYHRTGVLV